MQFQPKTNEECRRVIPSGTYSAVIKSAEEKRTQKGDPMFVVVLQVYGKDGRTQLITDYILPDGVMAYKLRHLCEHAGILDKYESGSIEPCDLEDINVTVKVGIAPPKDGYDESNKIADYVKKPEKTAQHTYEAPVAAPAGGQAVDDDSIPF